MGGMSWAAFLAEVQARSDCMSVLFLLLGLPRGGALRVRYLLCSHKGVQRTSRNCLIIWSTGLKIHANRAGPRPGPFQAPSPKQKKTKKKFDCIGDIVVTVRERLSIRVRWQMEAAGSGE